ncbi:MAG: DUF4435 domain-containing protein [Nitrospirae bacterium]|nr:DUF4435 domain-containing protein [Nitrospirota bacterium]MBF0591578.1 DUF4435 domain-containing protein [Nitrospirota bacterium]
MKDQRAPSSVADKVRMDKHKGSWLIVEGKTDKRVYEDFIDDSKCKIEPGHGKDKVIKILEILERDNFNRVLAIVDADFWHLENYTITSKNLFMTDTHDIETMILKSKAFDNFISEVCSPEEVNKPPVEILDLLIKNALPIGYLLWISSIKQLYLNFEKIKYESFIDHATLSIDVKEMIRNVVSNTRTELTFNESDLETDINSKMTLNYDVWQVCRGKDLIAILSIWSEKLFVNSMDTEDIKEKLAVTYAFRYFSYSEIYRSIRAWEDNNNAFKVFKQKQA